jgi:hypothetical protein
MPGLVKRVFLFGVQPMIKGLNNFLSYTFREIIRFDPEIISVLYIRGEIKTIVFLPKAPGVFHLYSAHILKKHSIQGIRPRRFRCFHTASFFVKLPLQTAINKDLASSYA